MVFHDKYHLWHLSPSRGSSHDMLIEIRIEMLTWWLKGWVGWSHFKSCGIFSRWGSQSRRSARAISIIAASEVKVQWASGGGKWSSFLKRVLASNSSLYFFVSPGCPNGLLWYYLCWKVQLVCWNQLYDNWQFLFLFEKQTNPNQSNRRSTVQWYFPL